MFPKVIGITGHYRSGKDSIGQILVSKYGYQRIALADKVREVALAINPIVETTIYSNTHIPMHLSHLLEFVTWEDAKKEPEVRRLLQVIGTDAGRNILGQDVWIKPVIEQIESSKNQCFVVTDVRFPNEADAIHKIGGDIWRVHRPGFNGDIHPSERYVEEIQYDVFIDNNGSLEDLGEQVESKLKKLGYVEAA